MILDDSLLMKAKETKVIHKIVWKKHQISHTNIDTVRMPSVFLSPFVACLLRLFSVIAGLFSGSAFFQPESSITSQGESIEHYQNSSL